MEYCVFRSHEHLPFTITEHIHFHFDFFLLLSSISGYMYGVFLCLFLFYYALSLFFVFNFSFIHNKHVFPGVHIQQIPFHRMAKEQRAKSQQQHHQQQQQQQQHRLKCIWRQLKYFLSEEEKTLSWNHMTFLLICCYGCVLVLVHVLSASDFLQHRWRTWTCLNMNIITGVKKGTHGKKIRCVISHAKCIPMTRINGMTTTTTMTNKIPSKCWISRGIYDECFHSYFSSLNCGKILYNVGCFRHHKMLLFLYEAQNMLPVRQPAGSKYSFFDIFFIKVRTTKLMTNIRNRIPTWKEIHRICSVISWNTRNWILLSRKPLVKDMHAERMNTNYAKCSLNSLFFAHPPPSPLSVSSFSH